MCITIAAALVATIVRIVTVCEFVVFRVQAKGGMESLDGFTSLNVSANKNCGFRWWFHNFTWILLSLRSPSALPWMRCQQIYWPTTTKIAAKQKRRDSQANGSDGNSKWKIYWKTFHHRPVSYCNGGRCAVTDPMRAHQKMRHAHTHTEWAQVNRMYKVSRRSRCMSHAYDLPKLPPFGIFASASSSSLHAQPWCNLLSLASRPKVHV